MLYVAQCTVLDTVLDGQYRAVSTVLDDSTGYRVRDLGIAATKRELLTYDGDRRGSVCRSESVGPDIVRVATLFF